MRKENPSPNLKPYREFLVLHLNPRTKHHGDVNVLVRNSFLSNIWGAQVRQPDSFPLSHPGNSLKWHELSITKRLLEGLTGSCLVCRPENHPLWRQRFQSDRRPSATLRLYIKMTATAGDCVESTRMKLQKSVLHLRWSFELLFSLLVLQPNKQHLQKSWFSSHSPTLFDRNAQNARTDEQSHV